MNIKRGQLIQYTCSNPNVVYRFEKLVSVWLKPVD